MSEPAKESTNQPLDQLALQQSTLSVGLGGKVIRAIQILQHYQLSQMAQRAVRIGLRRIQPRKRVGAWTPINTRLNHSNAVSELAQSILSHHADHPSHSKCDLEGGKFVLLNHEVNTGNCRPEPTALQSQTHLWRFQYHYHEFLLSQATNGNWNLVSKYLTGWLQDYPPYTTRRSDDSWHPYCISRRVVAWVWLLVCSSDQGNLLSEKVTQQLLQSLAHQAQYLSENLEWELGGNHLVENATALAIVGGVLETNLSEGWLRIAKNVLKKEVPKQILGHGEHFELSPMYHCQILSNFLRIEICCERDWDLKSLVIPSIEPMMNFLGSILHPDNEIPLFGDSVFHEAPSVQQIADVAKFSTRDIAIGSQPPVIARIDNYIVLNSEGIRAICDFGSISAPNLPAHGHCDVLNLEVSIKGKRWIVDSGNFNYSNDSMRHYCRSSIGHNVATVDDANQANVWSMFRMGRRPKVFDCRSGSTQEWNWAVASHDGYKNLGFKKITRLVTANYNDLACIDLPNVSANAKGDYLVGYLHFHPDVDVCKLESAGDSKFLVCLEREDVKRWLLVFADSVTLEQGWYCEQFGKRTAGGVIRYATNIHQPYSGWFLQETSNRCEIEYHDLTLAITMGPSRTFTWNLG